LENLGWFGKRLTPEMCADERVGDQALSMWANENGGHPSEQNSPGKGRDLFHFMPSRSLSLSLD
jgi:hypothetical protein